MIVISVEGSIFEYFSILRQRMALEYFYCDATRGFDSSPVSLYDVPEKWGGFKPERELLFRPV
jgi:hypothetical protein